MKKVLVTGGSGFVGYALTNELFSYENQKLGKNSSRNQKSFVNDK
jgi:nucleoside-diphosphate-sugar epimerase